jgi:F-type H+-transporting ATPase subunit b
MDHEVSFFAEPRSWVAIAFVIFFVLFGKKLWSVATDLLDKRAETIRLELAEAQRLRTEAEAMLKEAAASRADAMTRATELLEGAKREAVRLAAEAAEDAAQSAARREKMAMDRIAAAEKAAVDEVRHAAADVASEAAKVILTESMSHDTHSIIVDRAIAALPAALSTRAA